MTDARDFFYSEILERKASENHWNLVQSKLIHFLINAATERRLPGSTPAHARTHTHIFNNFVYG